MLAIAPAAIQFAEAQLAMGNKRTHAAGLGERQRLTVLAFSVFGASCAGDVTAEPESVGFVSSSP